MHLSSENAKLDLPADEAHLHHACPEQFTEAALLASLEGLLSDDERARRARFVFERDRHRFLITRALVRTVLSRYSGTDPQAWRFETNRHGKPAIAAPEAWRDLRFNVSHTPGLVCCAAALARDVGVDAECIDRRPPSPELAERYFAPSEAARLRTLPPDEFLGAFLDYWTLKEAYIKARGMGLALPLSDFAFHLDPAEPVRITFAPGMNDDPRRWQFERLTLGERHKVALAVARSPETDVRLSLHAWAP